jgi:predicted AlkP superfamily pyrophosphatase or phosphodiesterase
MRRVTIITAVLALVTPGWPAAQQPGEQQHVVLISIDGLAAYHLEDASIALPNIRALAAAGARAAASETVFPSMTHPAHTTLITGTVPRQHGVVDNRVVDRRTGRRLHITNIPRRESINVPTLFDAVRASGRRTAAYFWPETKDDSAIDDNFAEVFDGNDMADPQAIAPSLLADLRTAGISIDSYFALYDDPFTQGAADVVLTQAAIHTLKTRKPALLALHLLVADKVQHEFGPDHYLSRAALTAADHCIGLLRNAVAEAGLGERTTFIVAADHGFVTVRDEMNIAPLLEEPSLDGRVRWQADGWFVWGALQPAFDRSRDMPALERVLARVAQAPGIARIVRPGEFAALGYPEYDENHYVPGHYLIAGEISTHLVLDAKSPTTTRRPRTRPYHGHGYFPDAPPMRAALVLSGRGIAPGRSLGSVRNIDIAPTIAALLGVELRSAIGNVLRDALQ